MGDNVGELCAHGDQEGFLVFVELVALFLLYYQYVHYAVVVDDWCVEEGGVVFFAGFGEVVIATLS